MEHVHPDMVANEPGSLPYGGGHRIYRFTDGLISGADLLYKDTKAFVEELAV